MYGSVGMAGAVYIKGVAVTKYRRFVFFGDEGLIVCFGCWGFRF